MLFKSIEKATKIKKLRPVIRQILSTNNYEDFKKIMILRNKELDEVAQSIYKHLNDKKQKEEPKPTPPKQIKEQKAKEPSKAPKISAEEEEMIKLAVQASLLEEEERKKLLSSEDENFKKALEASIIEQKKVIVAEIKPEKAPVKVEKTPEKIDIIPEKVGKTPEKIVKTQEKVEPVVAKKDEPKVKVVENTLPQIQTKPKDVEQKNDNKKQIVKHTEEVKPQPTSDLPKLPLPKCGELKKPHENDAYLHAQSSGPKEIKPLSESTIESTEQRRVRLMKLRDQFLEAKKKKMKEEAPTLAKVEPKSIKKDEFIEAMKKMKTASPEKKEEDKKKAENERRKGLMSKIKCVMQDDEEELEHVNILADP